MSLSKELTGRLNNWLEELQRQFYRPLGNLELQGFTTANRLSPELAAKGSFQPMPVGTAWGGKWEYAWFRASLTLPAEVAGQRIVLRFNPGSEGLIFVNGLAAGARDRHHHEITLTRSAQGGEHYDILAEFYAGHGPIAENIGPVPPGRIPLPEPGPTQRRVEPSHWGIWDEDAYGLYIDAETLLQTREGLPETSLRVARIDEALRDFTRIVDFEQDPELMRASFRAARTRLKPLLECVNGSTAPTMYIFGQSHIDLAWQWPQEETVRKSARTVSSQLALLDEYPEYRFMWCQVPLFEMLRDHYPEIWQRLKARIANGTVMVEGGMWLEPDTNLPGGEALIRQVMLAKEFFRDELGQETLLLWLPDTFGFSAALPQIMKGTGLRYFGTKKVIDVYGDGEVFPHVTFRWQGIDGSEVLAHIFRKSNSIIDPRTLNKRWNVDRRQMDNVSTYLFPFGYGDGGGGPTRTHLEFTRRLADLEGVPRTKWSHPVDYYRDRESSGPVDERHVGELYFPQHRGTYTSQARTKKANRRAEIAMREMDLWIALASVVAGITPPREEIRQLWRGLLFNHFHDIISGASIKRVHEEAVATLAQVASRAGELARNAAAGLVVGTDSPSPRHPAPGFAVFNSLAWERTVLLRLPTGSPGLIEAGGNSLPIQSEAAGTWLEISLPATGWTGLSQATPDTARPDHPAGQPQPDIPPVDRVSVAPQSSGFIMENRFLRVTIDGTGRLIGIFDKESGLEIADGPCNDFHLYKDVPANYDAWDIDSDYRSLPVEIGTGDAKLSLVSAGPLLAVIRLERTIAASTLVQEIRLARNSRRIEFHTDINWQENHKLLKVGFPTRLRSDDALYEIQFGHIRRPTHRNRRYDADRFEGCHHKWTALAESGRGVALLNDSKYGSDILGNTLTLTLLKAAWVPDMTADRGAHSFAYAFLVWNGDFAGQGPVREAYDFNIPPLLIATSTAATGSATTPAKAQRSLLSIEKPAIVLETIKSAEDGSGDLVLRCYESSGSATRTAINLGFDCSLAWLTDMLESQPVDLKIQDRRIDLEFRAFEIKTIRLRPVQNH